MPRQWRARAAFMANTVRQGIHLIKGALKIRILSVAMIAAVLAFLPRSPRRYARAGQTAHHGPGHGD